MLKKDITAFIDKTDTTTRTAVYIEDLMTGEWIGIRERERFAPLSLLKIPLAVAAMRKVDLKIWTLQQPFVLLPQDFDSTAGTVWKTVKAGQSITLEFLLDSLLVESDNTVLSVIRRSLTPDEVQDVLYHMGMIFPEAPKTIALSPKNFATLFRSLYHSTYLTLPSAQYLLSVMTRSTLPSGLRAAIPENIALSHKKAWVTPLFEGDRVRRYYMHDVGIIYLAQRPVLLAVMTADLDEHRAPKAIEEIGRIVLRHYHESSGKTGP